MKKKRLSCQRLNVLPVKGSRIVPMNTHMRIPTRDLHNYDVHRIYRRYTEFGIEITECDATPSRERKFI